MRLILFDSIFRFIVFPLLIILAPIWFVCGVAFYIVFGFLSGIMLMLYQLRYQIPVAIYFILYGYDDKRFREISRNNLGYTYHMEAYMKKDGKRIGKVD